MQAVDGEHEAYDQVTTGSDSDSGSDTDITEEATEKSEINTADVIDKFITAGGVISTFKHKEHREQTRERRRLKKCTLQSI
jgi:hypothetical protein